MNPIESYLNDLNQFIEGDNFWQASLLKQLEDLGCEHALFRPAPERHCIWEVVRHIIYWKHWAITFIESGVKLNAKDDNWSQLPSAPDDSSWKADLEKLRSLHEQCKKIAAGAGEDLFTSSDEKIVFFRQLLYHDCYHAGQIGLYRVLQGLKPVT